MAGLAAGSELTQARGVEIGPARADDDAALRALLRNGPMPGRIRIALTREPSLFAADGMAGGTEFTVVARRDGRAVGLGRCTVHGLTRNGSRRRIGYLSALRLEPEVHGGARLIREGYEHLLERLAGAVDGCITSIAADNERARRVLERGRRLGLPGYQPLGELVTLVAPVPRRLRPGAGRSDVWPWGPDADGFLRDQGLRAHLALGWEPWQWDGLARHGVTQGDWRLVRHAGEIVAAGAVWDQRAFRQTRIDGYRGALNAMRPVVNVARWIAGRPSLPAPGTILAQGSLLGASVAEPILWKWLWPVLAQEAARRGLAWLSISRGAPDPELRILRHLTGAREYRTMLYAVEWPGGPRWPDEWDDRPLRPEVGLL